MTIRPTYANLVSTLALAVALGGTGAYAAGLAKNSVGSKQIKNNSVTGKDVKESSLKLPSSAVIVSSDMESGALTDTLQPVAAVDLVAPSAGVVMVTMQSEFNAADDDSFVTGELHVDGVRADIFEMDPGDTDGLFDERQTVTAVLPVTKGAHSYTLKLLDEGGLAPFTLFTETQVIVQFAPHGTAGSGLSGP